MRFFDVFRKQQLISDEATYFFNTTKGWNLDAFVSSGNGGFDALIKKFNLSDESLKAFLKDTNYAEKSLANYKIYLEDTATASSRLANAGTKVSSSLKMIGAFAANVAVSMAVAKVIEIAIEKWNDYANAQENALNRASDAIDKYKENTEKISKASKLIEDSGERFVALQKGISNGINVSLTTEEYEEYLSLANQIADTFPELVSGYDSLGNPIINTATSVETLNSALREQKILLAQDTTGAVKDFKDAFDAQVSYMATGKKEEAGLIQKLNTLNILTSSYLSAEDQLSAIKLAEGVSANIAGAFQDIANFITSEITDPIFGTNFEESAAFKQFDFSKKGAEYAESIREIMEDAGIENASALKVGTEEWDQAIKKIRDLAQQYKKELDNAFNDTKPLIDALFWGNKDYDTFKDSTKNSISQLINSLNFDNAKELGFLNEDSSLNTDNIEKWCSNVVEKINNSGIQDAIEELFSLDTKKDQMTFDAYSQRANELMNTISNSVPELSKGVLSQASGYRDSINEIRRDYTKLVDKFSKDRDKIAKLSNSEIKIAAKAVGVDDTIKSFEDLLNVIYRAESEIDLNASPLKDAVDKAFESENAGDKYKDMVTKGKTAKELYDKGEIGTDDFKTFAAWLSPTGADDAVNFRENYGKFTRYFTEDSAEGVHNFLKDLESKDFAESTKTIDANGDAIESWTYKISDLEDAAQKMGIGFEPMMEMFARLEDYGFSNNFVGSIDQGKEKISSKVSELAKAEAELAELMKPGQYQTDAGMTFGNQTAINSKRAEIDQLKQDIVETKDAMAQLIARTADDYKAQAESGKVAIETLKEERDKILADTTMDEETKQSIAGMMQDQIDAWAQEYHIEIDSNANITDSEFTGEEPVIPATANITDITGDFNINGTEDIEQLGDFLSLLQSGASSDITLTVTDPDNLDETLEKIKEVPKESSANFKFNVSNSQDAELIGKTIASINEGRSEENLITCSFNYVQSDNSPLETNGTSVEIEAELNTDDFTEKLKSLEAGQTITYFANVDDVERSVTAFKNPDGTFLFTANIDGVEQVLQPIQNEDGTINYSVGIQEDPVAKDCELYYIISGQDEANPSIAPVDYIKRFQENPEDKTAKVTYVAANVVPSIGSSLIKNGTGQINGTAHWNGTAYYYGDAYSEGTAMWQHYCNASRKAYAGGHWGLQHNADGALINELSPEIIVRNGEWFILNNGYPTLANLKRNDIIFNHEQTKSILEKGYVTGSHAKFAYSNGTISNNSLGKAFSGVGSGGGSFGIGGSGSASGISNITDSDSIDKNTSAVQENTDAQENLQDWIARLVEVQERELSSLESAIESFEMHSNQNKAIDAYVTKSEEYMKYLRDAQNAYARKANSVELSDDYKKKVRNGTLMIEDIQDENLRDAIQKYQDWYDKSKQLGEQLEEIKQTVRETKIEKLSNIKDDYDNLVSYAESLSDYYQQISDLSEEINLVGDAQALNSALNQQAVIRQTLINEQKELNDQLNALVKSGDIAEYSDTWLEWKTEINDIQKSILDCDSALNQLKKSIREIRLEDFYNSLDQLDFTSDMASSLRGLMSDEGVFDENAKLTNSGIAQLGLMGTELVAAKQKVANYNVAIEALNKDLENGDISQAEYNELLREYQRDQMEAVKATKDAKDAIINLIKNGIEKQTEAMEKLIQKRKDALSLQKEYYDFQKEMEDKSSEMNKIKAQINALSGDDSLEAQQKRRKLQSQLDELQKEYDDKQKEREHDVIQAAYDETLESFKENQEKTLHELETNLDAQNQAISDALAVAKDNYTVVYEELGVLATDYNVTLTDSIVTPWTDAISAIEQYQSAMEQLNGNISIDTTPITSDTASKNQTTPTNNEAKNQNMSKSENGTWIKQDGRWWYEHDDGSYTKNGWEKIDGKWYKFDEKGWMQTGWQPWGTDSKGKTAWYYLNDDGSMATSQWIEYKGKQYFVDHTGVMARYGYIKSKNSGLYYWVNNDGVWEPQWNTYKPDLDKYDLYYAKGSKRVPYSALAYTDDTEDHKLNLGSEAIITNRGVLREVHAGDMIFSEKQKQFLWALSNGDMSFDWQKNIPFVSDFAKNITNMIEKRDIGGDTNVENHYDALVKVVGDVTKEVYPGIQKVCEEAFNYTNKQYKKYSKR